ncbi:hypothetical protein R1flu_006615 [Riccia fluitans]|uniref:Uncharacterized protein n=1 Tax=Riccia fluitans TaxID=41844 RepID=A0ABD1YX56_9MARC
MSDQDEAFLEQIGLDVKVLVDALRVVLSENEELTLKIDSIQEKHPAICRDVHELGDDMARLAEALEIHKAGCKKLITLLEGN